MLFITVYWHKYGGCSAVTAQLRPPKMLTGDP